MMLTLRQVTLSRGHKVLLDRVSVSIHEKQKIGLIGYNGCGKSTLFSFLRGQMTADAGELQINPHLRMSHLSQHLPDTNARAIDCVLEGDEDYFLLQQRLIAAETSGDDAEILKCHETLSHTAGYSKPALAASLLSGLGFKSTEQEAPVNSFSGGWRMRLSLARCLMKPADLLLLDEPTNHLDMEAIVWLEKWLKLYPGSIVLISHDREFLDGFVSHILHVEHKNMTLYTGNYSRFEITRAQQLAQQQAVFDKQQNKIAHMMSFVKRFGAKATKSKQAQSRLKAIANMELVAQAQADSPFSFDFFPCPRANSALMHCEAVKAGYAVNNPVVNVFNMTINPGDRIALLGPNGEGKSTLIKTLTGDLAPLSGIIHRSPHLKVGYYAQHQLEHLDSSLSPLQTIQRLSTDVTEQEIRNFLGGFNFIGDSAVNPIHYFSGGEKARLALAKLVWEKPNLLLLDEPTNHLDLGMRAALEVALQTYEGALVLISHDRHLLRSTVDDYYLLFQKKLDKFDGDLDDYHQWLLTRERLNESAKSSGDNDYRLKKTMQNRIKKLEQIIDELQYQLSQVEDALASDLLYENAQKAELQILLKKRDEVQQQLMVAEDEWLEVMALLEG